MTAKTDKGISEAASAKRKRGRPPIMGEEVTAIVDLGAGENVKTHRHKLNVYYQMRALAVLPDDPRFTWLVGRAKAMPGAKDAWKGKIRRQMMNRFPGKEEWIDAKGALKQGILSELGRFGNDEDVKDIALHICELKPKTKNAVAMIRRWQGKGKPGDAWGLSREIVRTVNDYLERHPEMPKSAVETAFMTSIEMDWQRRAGDVPEAHQ
jgi:hypothetical protein